MFHRQFKISQNEASDLLTLSQRLEHTENQLSFYIQRTVEEFYSNWNKHEYTFNIQCVSCITVHASSKDSMFEQCLNSFSRRWFYCDNWTDNVNLYAIVHDSVNAPWNNSCVLFFFRY